VRGIRSIAATGAVVFSLVGAAAALPPHAVAAGFTVDPVCGPVAVGYARCLALRATGGRHLSAAAGPAGYHPADLQSAYKLATTGGAGQTVAIVDAFDDPNAESDLAVYRAQFGLPPCTTANGCFRKRNQTGGTVYPPPNVGWAAEISLDLDMVSAICKKCHILLVEANSNSIANLAAAVNEAAVLGATEISNSYGGGEFSGETSFAASYNHPGIPITASSGDAAYAAGPQVPAAYRTLTAVGGTNLQTKANTRGWKEKVWSGAGSGCSSFITKPAWQVDTSCSRRTIADVSAVADPATGVSVYDTYGQSGWLVFGGTSVSAPIIASVYALAGNGSSINNASFAYAHTSSLFDVKKGSNGSCGSTYLCTGLPGYDAPTGLGTPNGTGAF
jgi:subtilase family serine protease